MVIESIDKGANNMSKISQLDKVALQNLRSPIEAELKALGERLGISFQLGNGTFGAGAEASFKLIMTVNDPDAKRDAARIEWNRNCRFIGIDYTNPDETGLRAEDFGTEFDYGGATFRTTGIAVKGRGSQKFPILCEIVKVGPRGGNVGEVRMLPETAARIIRAATDAAAKVAA
jgi:hypothetical protein